MKKLNKIFVLAIFLSFGSAVVSIADACSVTQCINNGCWTVIVQYEDDWAMNIACDDGAGWGGGGSGQWGGTIGGDCQVTPCLQ